MGKHPKVMCLLSQLVPAWSKPGSDCRSLKILTDFKIVLHHTSFFAVKSNMHPTRDHVRGSSTRPHVVSVSSHHETAHAWLTVARMVPVSITSYQPHKWLMWFRCDRPDLKSIKHVGEMKADPGSVNLSHYHTVWVECRH